MYSSIIDIINGSLFNEIINLAVQLKRKPETRKKLMIYSFLILVLSLAMLLFTNLLLNNNEILLAISLFGIAFSLPTIGIGLLSYVIVNRKSIDEVILELEDERKKINEKLEDEKNVLDVIRINLSQLNEYYIINKIQAKRSYNLSFISIIFGLIILLFSILYAYLNNEIQVLSIIGVISGAFAEFIGLTSLNLYKESNKNVNQFYRQLNDLQKTMLAIELTKNLELENRNIQVGNIIESLIRVQNTN